MKSELRKNVLEETYEDVQKLIFGVVWKFWSLYGGCIDDLIGQANLIFIDAFDRYDSSKGVKITTWIAYKINKGLFDYMRKGNGYEPHTQIDGEFVEMFAAPNKNFSVMELLDKMGQDAHIVLQLFLETPRETIVGIRNDYDRIDHVQAAIRKRLRNRLRQMGWTARRIKEAFDQIKNATSY